MIENLEIGKAYRVTSVGDGEGGSHNYLFKDGLSFRKIRVGEVLVIVTNPSVERIPKYATSRKSFYDVLAEDGQIYTIWFPKSKKNRPEKYSTFFEEI